MAINLAAPCGPVNARISLVFVLSCCSFACSVGTTESPPATKAPSDNVPLDEVDCSTDQRPDPTRWNDDIEAFAVRDEELTPPDNAIVFAGSSSIRLWDSLAEDMAPHATVKNGFGGSHLSDVLHHYESLILPYDPRAIVFYAGENDLALDSPTPPGCVLRDFETLVESLRDSGVEAPLFFASLKPSPARAHLQNNMDETNHYLAAFAEQTPNVTFIDVTEDMTDEMGAPRAELFAEDALHLNADGYAIWTSAIKPHLDSL